MDGRDHNMFRSPAGVLYFQIATPADLVEAVGRKVIKSSLRTRDIREARERRDVTLVATRERFRRLRENRPLEPAEIERERQAKFSQIYDEARAMEPEGVELWHELFFEHEMDQDGDSGEWYERSSFATRERAREIAKKIGANAEDAATIDTLAKALVSAERTALRTVMDGKVPPEWMATQRVRRVSGTTVREAAQRYQDERERDPAARMTEQTVGQTRATLRLFADVHGDDAMAGVDREDASNFLDKLGTLDPHYGRSGKAKGLSLDDLLRSYAGPPFLANRTLNRHTSTLATFYEWARRRGIADVANPFKDQQRKVGKNGWQPFAIDELNALFDGASFEPAIGQRGSVVRGYLPWFMLIALYSGMRLGEIAGLRVADVQMEDDVTYFHVVGHDERRVKSEAAVRRVPAHSAIVAQGFTEYLANVKSAGEEYLFPGLKPGGPDGKRSWYLSRAFNTYRAKAREVTRAGLSFHSFRKNFVGALERARVHQSEVALLVGHERGFTFSVYSPLGLDMHALADVVERVTYPKLKVG